MATSTHPARLKALAASMAAENTDVLVLFGNNWHADHLRYATDFGIQEGQGIALVRADGATTLILDDPAEAERARAEAAIGDILYAPSLVKEARRLLTREGNRQIGAAPFHLLPYGLLNGEKDLRVNDGTKVIERLLMTKLEVEMDAVRRAAKLADEGYAIFRDAARPGRKDYELVAEIETFFRAKGVPENFMIIGVGGQEVRGMAPPGGKVLKPGDMVTTELTPCVDGYYAQICRTLVVGEANEAQKQAFAVYLEAMEAGIAAVAAGVTAAEVAKAENDVFRKFGLGDYVTSEYTRVRGHGMGLFPDQKPQILEDVQIPLETGMTIIVHPNTYHPAVGYLVLGDSLIVRDRGHELLCGTPRQLFSVQ
ncbi:Xaa-Pro peptidase family protein [Methylocella sp. CPCC 101449]|uniref:M24 family metallopeptidase n=1 Tax=Methylocella sp. CPCC 101449 TaxID=2987531 RepID=UPI00288CD9DF|nr:Xaa-Pro peptidase family protein [Methylocella sp. CPCC 101449]MDT2023534.1 Xaa-Pro peptidase family protein [Methylocella sp. CPCC 101449]